MPNSDTKSVIAVNLARLLQWARDHDRPYGSPKTLAAKLKIGHMTIYRILDGGGAQLDTLDAIASAFRLRAWQLMIPDLDPSNPPTVPYTQEEKRLYERIGKVLKAVEDDTDSEGEDLRPGVDRKGASDRVPVRTKAKTRKASKTE